MHIRTYTNDDLDILVEMTIETFRPFYEGYVRELFGDDLFALHHGQWEQDYRDEVPTLHVPDVGRTVAVAEVDGAVAGYVAWKIEPLRPDHGEICLVAVDPVHRRLHVARELCSYAINAMKAQGVDVVGIGTGDDAFHTAARGLYESLGFTKIPIAGYLRRI
jgi:ribosomal protein S18 acetylase RimI-like enzyme